MTNLKNIVKEAIAQTKEKAGEYFTSVLMQRLPGNEISAGSYFVGFENVEKLQHALENANWSVSEGSLEEGKIILVTTDFKGKEGIALLEEVPQTEIKIINPKQIPGRDEQSIVVDSVEDFNDVNTTYLIISTYNPQTKTIEPKNMFIPTTFPGSLIGPDDTLVGGKYVKMIRK